jgi:hypothetical protein
LQHTHSILMDASRLASLTPQHEGTLTGDFVQGHHASVTRHIISAWNFPNRMAMHAIARGIFLS